MVYLLLYILHGFALAACWVYLRLDNETLYTNDSSRVFGAFPKEILGKISQ